MAVEEGADRIEGLNLLSDWRTELAQGRYITYLMSADIVVDWLNELCKNNTYQKT